MYYLFVCFGLVSVGTILIDRVKIYKYNFYTNLYKFTIFSTTTLACAILLINYESSKELQVIIVKDHI